MPGNGPGVSSREEAQRYHTQRFVAKPTNLNYNFGPRIPNLEGREDLPLSPLDGERYFQEAQATSQAQTQAMQRFHQDNGIQQEVEQGLIPKPPSQPRKKSLKEIAMERGHIPRKE